MTDITLIVDGRRHEGWAEASVTRALENISGKFSMTLSERAPGETTPRNVAPGGGCRVLIDGEAVISGYVDTVRATYDAGRHEISIDGRDATGDLVDCSAASKPGEWHDEKLERIAAALTEPFGVPVRAEADTGIAFKRFRVEEAETVFEAIERGCRMRGILPLADGAGGIILGRPTKSRSLVRLRRGINILSASGEANWLERHSDYTLLGQQPGDDFLQASDAAHVIARATDSGVTRHRPLTILAEQALDAAEAEARIEWEAVVRAARARRATVTVQGWREGPGGALWTPGRLVSISDDWLGLDRQMLIAAVEQTISADGELSMLTLMPQTAFVARIKSEPEETRWWG